MRKQKTSLALFFTGVLVINILGYALFSIGIVTHKKWVFNRIKAGVGNEEVAVFNAASLQNARWENKKEFEWEHQMYDVIKVEQINGHLVYTCKKDCKEDDLKDQRQKSSQKKLGGWVKIFVEDVQFFLPKFITVPKVGWVNEIPNHYTFQFSYILHQPPLA